MIQTSPFVQVLWTCTQKGKAKAVLRAQIRSLRRQLCLFEMPLPAALWACQRCLPQLWWQKETQGSLSCFRTKCKSLTQAAPTPLGFLFFKHWTLSWSSLELSVFSVCWLRCVGGILWERGSNILNWHSYFQNNPFHAPLAPETDISFAGFRLVEQNRALVSAADFVCTLTAARMQWGVSCILYYCCFSIWGVIFLTRNIS